MLENTDDIKEIAQKCYEKISSKCIEITLIVLISILLAIYIICFSVINMEVYGGYGLLYFFILTPLLINFVFSIILRCWRSKNVIKTVRKKRGTHLTITGFVFTAIAYAFAMASDKVISSDVEEHEDHCKKYNKNCPHKYDDWVLYFTFCITEILSIFLLYAWKNLYNRIKKELDEPPSFRSIKTQTTDDPEKEETIPLEENDNRQGNTVSIYNNENIPNKKNKKSSGNHRIETIDSQDLIVK